jgi:hypothetical protein
VEREHLLALNDYRLWNDVVKPTVCTPNWFLLKKTPQNVRDAPTDVDKLTLFSDVITSVPRFYVTVNVPCGVFAIRHLVQLAGNAQLSSFQSNSQG